MPTTGGESGHPISEAAMAKKRSGKKKAGGLIAAGRATQFGKGNKGGPGNPLGVQVHARRMMLQAAVSDAAFKRICAKLVKMAEGGDLAAIKILLERLAGKEPASMGMIPVEEVRVKLAIIFDRLIEELPDDESRQTVTRVFQGGNPDEPEG